MNHILEHPPIPPSTDVEVRGTQLATGTVVLESLSGAAAGALVGAVAGPPGAVVGALMGGLAASLAGTLAHEEEVQRRAHDRLLDREIGVTEGDLGAGPAHASPAGRGTYSLASMGIHEGSRTPAEGPIEDLDD